MGALEILVGAFPEAFGVFGVDDLPVDQYDGGGEEETPAEKIADEQHGREHHEMAPIVNTAIDTALVLHDARLEGAEENDADGIAQEIEDGDHDQIGFGDDLEEI